MIEEWRPILGGYYEVSSFGQVRRLKPVAGCRAGRILKNQTNGQYFHVRLSTGSRATIVLYLVHRLVAQAFLGSCPIGKQVNHIDGNKRNNRYDNLEYVTPAENLKHAVANGLRHPPHPKLTPEKVSQIKIGLRAGLRQQDIANKFGVSQTTIHHINIGRTWAEVA